MSEAKAARPSERLKQIRQEIIDEKCGGAKQTVLRERIEREASHGHKLDFECLVRYLDERFDQTQKGKPNEKTS